MIRKPTDPLDALAQYLSELFNTKISMTDVFDVFVGVFIMVMAVTFIVRLKRASKGDDQANDQEEE